MEVRAAIATKAGAPLEVTTVNLEGPKQGEVLVQIKATGLCHTDALHYRAMTLKCCFLLF